MVCRLNATGQLWTGWGIKITREPSRCDRFKMESFPERKRADRAGLQTMPSCL
jgi:hypothetical protein